jgi:hypothetical protein
VDYVVSKEVITFIVIISSTRSHDTLICSSESEMQGSADTSPMAAILIHV